MIMLLLVKYYRKRHDIRKRGITLTRNILNAINAARKDFEIESFPGDFFEHLMMDNYTDRCRLLLFKEDIDKKIEKTKKTKEEQDKKDDDEYQMYKFMLDNTIAI